MVINIWGKKIGMTQVFSSNDKNNKVVPVTVVYLGKWFILQLKTLVHDGYDAIQVGLLRDKYDKVPEFSFEWLKNKKQYFSFVVELPCSVPHSYAVGSVLEVLPDGFIAQDQSVSVTGTTKGKGFQGSIKRHGFTGGRASHGDKLGRGSGSLSGLRTQGRVFKGKKMPGRMGGKTKTVLGLKVVEYRPEDRVVLISGPVPGYSGSFIKISKGHR